MEVKQTEVTKISGTITGTDSKMRSGEVRVRVRENNRVITKFAAIIFQKDLMVGLIPGNHIIITGHTERSVARNDEGVYRNEKGKLVYQHIFVADKIEPAKRALSKYLEIPEELDKGGAYGSDINESFIIGVVDSVSVSKVSRSAFVSIRVAQDDERENTRIVPFFGNRVNDAEKLNKGDLIALCGSLSVAPNPPLPGVENENVVCQDVLVLEKAQVIPDDKDELDEDEPEETLGDLRGDTKKIKDNADDQEINGNPAMNPASKDEEKNNDETEENSTEELSKEDEPESSAKDGSDVEDESDSKSSKKDSIDDVIAKLIG